MIRMPLKTPLDEQIHQYQSRGGQIRPAVNSGKVTTGLHCDKAKARLYKCRQGK